MSRPYKGACRGLWFIDGKVDFMLRSWSYLPLSGVYEELWVVVASVLLLLDNRGQERGQAIDGSLELASQQIGFLAV